MANMRTKKYLFVGLHLFSVICCIVLFTLLMLDSYEKFTTKMTNTGIQMTPMDKDTKYPPCVTICSLKAFKNRGFFFKESDFLVQTFGIRELLLDGKDYGFENESIFNEEVYSISKLKSLFLGQCQTICRKLTMNHGDMYVMIVNKTRDMKG